MPRAVVFASTTLGGIGLLDLFMEQGSSKITTILSHLRSHSPINETILILIETYPICAGITYPALENNNIYHYYVNSPWVQITKTFLNANKGQMYIPSIATIKIIRVNDIALMESPHIQVFTKSQLESINACQIYQKITTLAEITNENGTNILQIALKGKLNNNKTAPLLWQISQSTLNWPYQLRPPAASWNLWKKFLLCFTTNTPALQLSNPLGNWLTNVHQQRNWIYQYYHNDIIKISTPYQYYTQIPNRHHQQTYQLQHQYAIVPQNSSTPAIPFHITPESLSCHDSTHANQITANPTASTTCQPANVTYINDINNNNNLIIETVQIVCDGKIHADQITIGSVLN
jgi:hypothetical protein